MAFPWSLLLNVACAAALGSKKQTIQSIEILYTLLFVMLGIASVIFTMMMYRKYKADQSASKLQAAWKGDRARRRLFFPSQIESYDSVRI